LFNLIEFCAIVVIHITYPPRAVLKAADQNILCCQVADLHPNLLYTLNMSPVGREPKYPVIIITGTPGTGKSSHAQLLIQESPVPLKHINVGELVKDQGLHEGFDEEWQSYTVDEDKLLDELEPLASAGGIILDWHTCEIFPERWADLVVVLRCNHTQLWDRLEKRGYPLKKIQENNEAEIMDVVIEEARASYPEEIVVTLSSESMEDLERNVASIVEWIKTWLSDRERQTAEET